MRRRYTAERYRAALAVIREQVPDVAITTDVIAGFPGESDADFEATMALCREAGFAAIHAFPYSRRPHTGAAIMDGHLPSAVRRSRLERLLEIASESALAFRERFLGRTFDVLWEHQSQGRWQGLTPNYIRVYTSADCDLTNQVRATRLTTTDGDETIGVLEPALHSSRALPGYLDGRPPHPEPDPMPPHPDPLPPPDPIPPHPDPQPPQPDPLPDRPAGIAQA
jgi:threonylcarbamoyladenosine tRNA methylthiotransferase MtaB